MISCLYPDCTHGIVDSTDASANQSPEAAKRQIINHINLDHDDAHVLIACHHKLRELERYVAKTTDPTGKEIEVGEHVRSECMRCGQFVVEDAPTVTVSHDALGNDVLQIPVTDA
jgi:hypothetical protein